MTTTPKLIIRFALVAEQPNSRDEERLSSVSSENSIAGIKRYTGFVRGRDLYALFDHVSLEANPRAAKTGTVTRAIIGSLDETPELFPFKSKGILIGTSTYEVLQRNRFELNFEVPDSEGILDGGHNMLAFGIHMLSAVADEKEIARTWRRIAQCFSRKYDFKAAVAYGEKALELSTRIADRQNRADTLSQLFGPYFFLGRLDEAEQAARRAHAAHLELGNRRNAVAASVNLSTVLGEKGDQIQKAALLREVLRECEQAGFNDILAKAVNNLAVVYHDQGDYERSLLYLRRCAELMKLPPLDPYMLSTTHSNIAIMLAALGRNKEALAEYAAAEEFAKQTVEPEQVMHVRSNRAALYRTTGNPAKALEEMRPVAAYYETSSIRIDAIRALGEYAQTLLAAGDAKAAAEVGERCLREARTIGGPHLLWFTLWPLGDAYLALNDREKARAAFLEAISTVESFKLSGGEDEKDNFFHERTYPYQGMVSLLLQENRPLEALQYAERAKARLLLDVLRGGRGEIARAMTDAEKQRERDLSSGVAKIDAQLAQAGAAIADQIGPLQRPV